MFDLSRFHRAQAKEYEGYAMALAELRAGRKQTHWIWYIFPQLRGLGSSCNAEYYGLVSLEEARAYAADPILGQRLRTAAQAMLDRPESDARQILSSHIDAAKLCSCMTLFELADPDQGIYTQVLDRFYRGWRCPRTLKQLGLPYPGK